MVMVVVLVRVLTVAHGCGNRNLRPLDHISVDQGAESSGQKKAHSQWFSTTMHHPKRSHASPNLRLGTKCSNVTLTSCFLEIRRDPEPTQGKSCCLQDSSPEGLFALSLVLIGR